MSSKKTRHKRLFQKPVNAITPSNPIVEKPDLEYDPSKLDSVPATYQELYNYFGRFKNVNPYTLRLETITRIERLTNRPLICYLTKTHNLLPQQNAHIDDDDILGFSDLVYGIDKDDIDVFLVSNGGSVVAAERIVNLLRSKFSSVRFIFPGNAFSAATLIAFSGDLIIMDTTATLGPIDPQINGIPTRAILKGFERVQRELTEQGPSSLTAYMPLLEKYSLDLLEICRSAEELSKQLAENWLFKYHRKTALESKTISEYFSDYDEHKSHGRTIDRNTALEQGLNIKFIEDIPGVSELVRSLYIQYQFWFDKSPFLKIYENSRGICWGRHIQSVEIQIPQLITPPIKRDAKESRF
ncbi:MAG: hypothetical protein FJY65_05665 [Calditrichaeota bacterium]|nr:hypothetical protein [Calditrichota bacterium]